jgi:hypothetical protein
VSANYLAGTFLFEIEIILDPWFWILSGISYYNFSCFFIGMVAYTDIGQGGDSVQFSI